MYLDQIHILNYRSCKSLGVHFTLADPNVFIGLNDSGKSSILHAMNLLLGEKSKFNHLSDGNNKNDISNSPLDEEEIAKKIDELQLPKIEVPANSCCIIGKLVYDNNESIEFPNSNLSNPLMWSIESNKSEELWLLKVFHPSQNKTFLLQLDFEKKFELWDKKQTDINDAIKEFEVTAQDIENENGKGRFSSLEKIRAVYAKGKTELAWSEYRFAKGDKEIFPTFSLYDWNSSLEDVISAADDIMQEEIKVYLDPVKKEASDQAEKAESAINKKFGELKDVIKTVAKEVEEISSKVYFDVNQRISDVMLKKTNSDGQIHLENQGEGLKRQIWFSLIKAKASGEDMGPNQFIWAFDEPETHLYPGAQREFFDILKKVSKGNVQTMLCAHSTVFVDKSRLQTIQSAAQNSEGYSELSNCRDVDDVYSSLGVRNSDFLFFDKFLVVEGDTEQYLIPRFFELYTDTTLLDNNVQLINIQGKDKWTLNKSMIDKIMAGFKKSSDQVVYLFDNDMRFEIGQDAVNDNMFFVGDQDIEDSIGSDVWISLLNSKYQENISFTVEEINQIKADVPKGQNCNSNQKFYLRLKGLIRQKWQEAELNVDELVQLPSKGSESADFLLTMINSHEHIPDTIKLAFDKLKKD